MKLRVIILALTILLLNLYIVEAEENEYGVVEAWFNGKNATIKTIEGIRLKIGEPVEVRIVVTSKINGDVFLKLYEPGVTRAFNVINGPNAIEERIDNLNIDSGWSKTYAWIIAPNGAWKNGNAPINIFVQFNKGMNDKQIDFTIANPYILDEQNSGATKTQTPLPSGTAPGTTTPKAAPFPSALGVIAMLLGVWMWKRR